MKQPDRRAQLKRVLLLTALFVLTMGSSVNLYFVRVMGAWEESGVNLYLIGGFWHVALGMDDFEREPPGIKVYAFGAAEHYRKQYVNPENYQGLERLLYYLRLLFTTQAGSIIEWDILREPGMTRERFLSSPDLKLIIRISTEQAQRILRTLTDYIAQLHPDPVLTRPGRKAWYGEAVPYSLLGFNCATFVARLLFAGGVYTQAHIVHGGVPKDWRLPSSLIKNYLHSDLPPAPKRF
ncbi:hypothetical protein LM602_04185 [Candidatus Acetothermia bacterium]|jgi:hypothetical protein|nr:hypothetical protein [Candidatus Acetothermia bacterium]MCI2431740.1 hypothetical protein [Candidatus Acetothermia bacterium]MCI2435783.1 hypothetical protein [Candidatus Acetothermia bacterium]